VLAAAMVLADVVTGLWIGWLARIIVLALAMGGQLLSYMVGLSSVLQPDPELGAQATAVSRLLGLAAPTLLLASGLYAAPLVALAGSYRLIPPGALLPAQDAVPGVMAGFTQTFALALRLAAPFVLVGMVWQLAVGLVSRFTPRVQMHFLSMPGQIVGGLMLLALLSGALLTVWDEAVRDAFAALPGIADAARAVVPGR
jgi:flagellar biosynthetic protein FliR